MILKDPDNQQAFRAFVPRKTGTVLYLLIPILFAVIAVSAFYGGIILERKGVIREVLIPTIREFVRLPGNYVRGLGADPDHIYIDIKFKNYQKLEYARAKALQNNLLELSDDDYVAAKIRFNDDTLNVKLRLKGDTIEHLKGDKWSFRLKLKGDNTLWGMKQFSLQHPKQRNYLYEWLYHKILQKEDVLSLRYKFIKVTLNGKDLGIYAVEEHFEKRLVEHNQRREGPIIRFTEDLYWKTFTLFGSQELFDTEAYLSSDIDAFQTNKLLQNPRLKRQFIKAAWLLESFRRGELKTSQVFDVDKLAAFIAVTDLLGGHHANRWHNKRFYYNPDTSKLEPIGFDSMPGAPLQNITSEYGALFEGFSLNQIHQEAIFNDPVFHKKYIAALDRISRPEYLDQFFVKIADELESTLDILFVEFPYYSHFFSKSLLYENQKKIRKVLDPFKATNAYFEKAASGSIMIRVGNISPLPIEVLGAKSKKHLFSLKTPVRLDGKRSSRNVNYQLIPFDLPQGLIWSEKILAELVVTYRVTGLPDQKSEVVYPWSHLDAAISENDFIRQAPNHHQQQWFTVDDDLKIISIKPGQWEIGNNVIIPSGYKVVGRGNVRLVLINGAMILSYSPLDIRGSLQHPITIAARDGGQGLVALQIGDTSYFEHVTFKGLRTISQAGWDLPGAVTFYESPVELRFVRFIDCSAEDAFNTVRTKFKMERVHFENTRSDAFDADFCNGTVSEVSFSNCGNDCIDVSGTRVEIDGALINGAGDKAISAGEASTVRLTNATINQAEIAIASKDSSKLHGKNIAISNCTLGITAYQKKPEFGPAAIELSSLKMTHIKQDYLVENHSRVTVNKALIAPNQKKVKQLMYGKEFGKSSK